MPTVTERFTRAVEYARNAHAGQTRKGTTAPYLSHLLGVAGLVLEYGGDEDEAIAGLLHDVAEDQGSHHEAVVRNQFGERVARIVMACTDGSQESKADARTLEQKRANWQSRKSAYIEHLKTQPDDVLLVSACDKLHNARAIVQDIRNPSVGAAVFDRFTGKREGTHWYYSKLSEVFMSRSALPAAELAATINAMHPASMTPSNNLGVCDSVRTYLANGTYGRPYPLARPSRPASNGVIGLSCSRLGYAAHVGSGPAYRQRGGIGADPVTRKPLPRRVQRSRPRHRRFA